MGGINHGLLSYDAPYLPTDRALTVRKYPRKCPQDKFLDRPVEEEILPVPGNPVEPPTVSPATTRAAPVEEEKVNADGLNLSSICTASFIETKSKS